MPMKRGNDYTHGMLREEEKPGEAPYTQILMLELHKAVIEENRRQKAHEYSLRDERGKTFSLSFWSAYHGKEFVIIPAGTPICEKKLTEAMAEFKKSMADFGRWFGDDRRATADGLQRLIDEFWDRAKGGQADD